MKLPQRLLSAVPMIEDGAMHGLLASYRTAVGLADSAFTRFMRHDMRPKLTVDGDIGVVPISGLLAKKPDVWEMFSGIEDSDAILEVLHEADGNKDVKGILLSIDSPGGFSTSLDLADAVKDVRRRKPTVAYSSSVMASLAYYVASQADEVIAARTAMVGSIGVYMAHIDLSRLYESAGVDIEVFKNKEATFKAAGVFNTSLTEAQRENITANAQRFFEDFKAAVRANRPNVPDDAMRGQTVEGSRAKSMSLIDGIGSRQFAASVLRSQIRQRG